MNKQPFGFPPNLSAANPMLAWWQQQWLQSAVPVARLQLAWLQGLADTMQLEAKFLSSVAESGQRLSESFNGEAPADHTQLQAYYQQLVQEIGQAQMQRMEQVAQLTQEFRDRLWEEI